MQLVNTLRFPSLTSVPSLGDMLVNAGLTASGVVVSVDAPLFALEMSSAVSFAVGDVVTNQTAAVAVGTVLDVYTQEVMNYQDTFISQYANSPTMIALAGRMISAIDPYQLINDFYNDVWNIDTAIGYGLDVWGRIVGVSRVLQVPGTNNLTYFGFDEALPNVHSFGHGPFYSGPPASAGYVLTDDAYRFLILVKAAANISGSSYTDMNRLLMMLFPNRGVACVQSNGNMHMWLVINFTLQPFEIAILRDSGVFPTPTGVGMDIMLRSNTLGFAEAGSGSSTFGFGSFFGGFV